MTTMTVSGSGGWVLELGFGARLRAVRRRMGWTQEQLAALIGRSKVQLDRWENGAEPRDLVAVAVAVARVSGCSAAWLAGRPVEVTDQETRFAPRLPTGKRDSRARLHLAA